MTIKNSVSNDFKSTFVDSIGVFDCRLPGVNDGSVVADSDQNSDL